MSHSNTSSSKTKHFSVLFFAITIIISVAICLTTFAFVAPTVWQTQLDANWKTHLFVFCLCHLAYGIFEHPFHRYVLHVPLIPGLIRFYKAHTHHHRLTVVAWQPAGVKNKYAIITEEQHENSFFPWYSYLAFALVLTPFIMCVQFIFPSAPILLEAYLALAFSMSLYEIKHAKDHKDLKEWLPRLEHSNPILNWFWNLVYSHHIGHHASIYMNMNISGFFGIPIGDMLFGTLVFPRTRYPAGAQIDKSKFNPPIPYPWTRWLDVQAEKSIVAYNKKRKDNAKKVA
jgi:hemolysin III